MSLPVGKTRRLLEENHSRETVLRHKANIERFYAWSENRDYNLLVSPPRSGRDWLRNLIEQVSGMKTGDYRDIDGGYDQYILFTIHNDGHEQPAVTIENCKNGRVKLILLVRDPRDSCLSQYYLYHDPDELSPEQAQKRLDGHAEGMVQAWNRVFKHFEHHASLILRYEDLCMRPVGEVQKVLALLGVEKYHKSIEQVILREDIRCFGRPLLDANERFLAQQGKWKRDEIFSPAHAQIIESRLEYQMKQFRYL